MKKVVASMLSNNAIKFCLMTLNLKMTTNGNKKMPRTWVFLISWKWVNGNEKTPNGNEKCP